MSYGCGRVQCANILSLLFCAALCIYIYIYVPWAVVKFSDR